VQQRRRDADSLIVTLHRPDVSGQFPKLWVAQFFPKDGISPLIPPVITL
jgi:hypothetical protein